MKAEAHEQANADLDRAAGCVNGVAATFLRTKRECLKMAAFGHEDQPDAIVELVEFDVATNTDTVITRLYN